MKDFRVRCLIPVLGLVSFGIHGCGGRAAPPEEGLVRDRAGVRIVESDGAYALPSWIVSEGPTFEVGGDEVELHDVVGATRMDDGTLIIADAGSHLLRYFDPQQRPAGVFGGEGEGPGEFRQIGALWPLAGDSIAVWDFRLGRLSVVTRDARLVRVTSPHPAPAGAFLPMLGIFDDGSFLLTSGMDVARLLTGGSGTRRDTVSILRYAATGALLDTLGRFPGDERHVLLAQSGFDLRAVPFGKRLRVAVAPDRIFLTSGDTTEILVLSPEGVRQLVIRERRPLAPVTGADRRAYLAQHLGELSGERLAREQTRLDQLPFPAVMGAYESILVDRTECLWVRRGESTKPHAPHRWMVFAPEGRNIASVEIPARLRLLEIGADYILGVTHDEMGVERVRKHALHRGEVRGCSSGA